MFRLTIMERVMFINVGQFDGFFFIKSESESESLILSSGTVQRAKSRFERKSEIRDGVKIDIDSQGFIFTKKEFERGRAFATVFQIKFSHCNIFKIYRAEAYGRHKIRLRQQKMIDLRARKKADVAGFVRKP